jgi:hypothetical protein
MRLQQRSDANQQAGQTQYQTSHPKPTTQRYHQQRFPKKVVFAEASRRTGRTVDRVVSIMDASGLTLVSLTGFAQRLFRAIAGMDSDNYPETCNNILIVNNAVRGGGGCLVASCMCYAKAEGYVCTRSTLVVPTSAPTHNNNQPPTHHPPTKQAAFTAIWKVVRVFIDPGTRDKVRVLGSGSAMLVRLCPAFVFGLDGGFVCGGGGWASKRIAWCFLYKQRDL